MRIPRLVLATIAVTAVSLTALSCSSGTDTGTGTTTTGTDDTTITGEITVFGAASLKATFTELGATFERDHPGTTVTFSFAGSSDLAAQIQQGAPADVFAAADTRTMASVTDDGLAAGSPTAFATNTLTIVTAPGNPLGITRFADLAAPGRDVVICAPQVPCGSATASVEKTTGITLSPVSEESSVTDVLGKVTSGQADAGLVYVTDAQGAAGKVASVAFPESSSAVNTYPITPLRASRNPATARAFVDLVTSPQGREVLSRAGFAAP